MIHLKKILQSFIELVSKKQAQKKKPKYWNYKNRVISKYASKTVKCRWQIANYTAVITYVFLSTTYKWMKITQAS